jgi:hypothetical protein
MRQKSGPVKESAEMVVKDIRRATRRHFSVEDVRGGASKAALSDRPRFALPRSRGFCYAASASSSRKKANIYSRTIAYFASKLADSEKTCFIKTESKQTEPIDLRPAPAPWSRSAVPQALQRDRDYRPS